MSTPLPDDNNQEDIEEALIQEAFNNMFFERGGLVGEILSINLRVFE